MYSWPANSFNPATSGNSVLPADWNSSSGDVATAISNSVAVDGQSTITANLPMSGFKLTGLGQATTAGDSVRFNEFSATLRSQLAGLTLSNDGLAPNTKIDVAAGNCADSTNLTALAVSAGSIDCTTVGANGLDAGTLAASTTYHAFAIGQSSGTTALLASTSPSAPTLPGSYTLFRRIGSFRTDSSAHILPFVQQGDYFYVKLITDFNAVGSARANSLATFSVPTGIVVQPLLSITTSVINGDQCVVDLAPAANSALQLSAANSINGNGQQVACTTTVVAPPTNTSSQINLQVGLTSGSSNWTIQTYGWIDLRGKNL